MAEEPKKKEYVVVTRVTPVREGGKTFTHAYGPYTKDSAVHQKGKILKESIKLCYRNRITVSVCKMLDPELANG